MSEWFNKALGRWIVTTPDGRQTYRYRALMEQHLGRRLRPDEHVHHINGDQTDDRLENLQVLSAHDHAVLHIPERKAGYAAFRGDAWGPDGLERCVECGTSDRPHVALGECGRCYYRNRARITRGYAGPRKPATIVTATCEECCVEFSRPLRTARPPRFCGKPCASRFTARERWAKQALKEAA